MADQPTTEAVASASEIDREQLKTLVRFSLKRAWRGTTNPFNSLRQRAVRFPGLLAVMLMNFAMSILFAMVFAAVNDLFTGLVLGGIGAMSLVGLQVLLEYSHIIITPDDYHIVSPHPVSSRTFYLAKLGHFLIFVVILSLTVSLLPAIAAGVILRSAIAAPVVLVHFTVCNLFSGLLMITVFTAALHMFKKQTLERILGYIQVAFLMCMYVGYIVAASKIQEILQGVDATAIPWFKLSPSYWFATPVWLARNGWDTTMALLVLFGLALLAWLARLAVSRLSLTYAESLSKADVHEEHASRRSRRTEPGWLSKAWQKLWRWYSQPEDRAVLSLLKAQYRFDMRFRLGVIWVVPYTFVILFYEWWRGFQQYDPFAMPAKMTKDPGMMMPLAVALLPFVLHAACRSSKYWQGAWVFHVTPVDRVRLVLATKRLITVLFILPIGVFYFGVYSYLYGNVLHAALQSIFVVAVALIGLTVLNLLSAGLPFAEDNPYGQFTTSLGVMMPVMFVIMVPLMVIAHHGYGGYIGWAIWLTGAILLNAVLTSMQYRRIRKQIPGWEFVA